MSRRRKSKMQYRYYQVPDGCPFLTLLGQKWVQSYGKGIDYLHFHNYMEFGYCYDGRGELVIADKSFRFEGGQFSVIPQNCPHTTNSDPGTKSRWEYGGLGMPVFTFLLVEGFLNTSDYRRYLCSMAAAALVSEIPYDMAMEGKFADWTSQNAMVSMCICLLMLHFLQMFQERKGIGSHMAKFAVVLGAVLWVTLLRAQYGLCLVLLTAVFYLFYTKNVWKTVLGIIVSLLYVTGPLAFYLIGCYNGKRNDRVPKYVYYVFYPLHLLVFALIIQIL